MYFHWKEVTLKWAALWCISLCSFAVWLTMHFNKPEAVELLSAHGNETLDSSLSFAVITFYLFLKASWIRAHCSVVNHICSIRSSYFNFQILNSHSSYNSFHSAFFTLVVLSVIYANFPVPAGNHLTVSFLSLLSLFSTLIPMRQIFRYEEICEINLWFLMNLFHTWVPWGFDGKNICLQSPKWIF